MSDSEKERRSLGRKDLTTFIPTVFSHKGKDYRCLLNNLSESGGRFKPQNLDQIENLSVGDVLELEIRTDKGLLNVQAEISWIRQKEAYFSWGARFMDLDDSKNKIIRDILDSIN